jgi:ribosomal protein S18 acetylase RimI-like enzyme
MTPESPRRREPDDPSADADRVREALPSDLEVISRVVGRAFFDDPMAAYLFPNLASRTQGFGAFAQIAIEQFAGAGISYVTAPSICGAAIWQAPSPPETNPWRQISMAARLVYLLRGRFPRLVRLGETVQKVHITEPHWYLAILGTDPEVQGRGIGSALLGPTLSRCDRDGEIAYLESSKESNILFYQRHGFSVLREVQIPDGPKLWPMLRRPR